MLAPYGLTVSDARTDRHILISDRKGAAEVAAGLPAIWQTADRLSARRIDALDPILIEALTNRGAESEQL